jgi:hypothetical protein
MKSKLLGAIASYFGRSRRRRIAARCPRYMPLGFERLETRVMPAVVTAVWDAAVNGDVDSNGDDCRQARRRPIAASFASPARRH